MVNTTCRWATGEQTFWDTYSAVSNVRFWWQEGHVALLGAWAPWHCGQECDLCSLDEEVRLRGVTYAKRAVDLAAEFEQPPLFQLCACPIKNEYPISATPIDTLRRQFVRSAAEIATYADPKGVNIAIEPINKFEGHAGFMNSIPEALSVIDEIDASNMGIQADFFHMNMRTDISLRR